MITCRLLAGICTIIFVITLVTSNDDSGSDEEGSDEEGYEREIERTFANAAPEIEPSKRTAMPETAMDDKSTLITAQLFDLRMLVKTLRSLIFETVEFFFKLNTPESDIKQTESKPKSSRHSTDDLSEDSLMQLFNSTTDNYKYSTPKSSENSDTNTVFTIDHDNIPNSPDTTESEIGTYTSSTFAADTVPGLQNNGSLIQSTRSSSSVPVTRYHSKADNGPSLSSTQHFANQLMAKFSPSVTVLVPRSTVSRTASSSATGPTITPPLSKHVKPNPSLSITTSVPQNKTVNRTVTSHTTGPTITSFSTEHFTSNPSPSTTVHATQHTTVNRTVPSSTTGPTIIPLLSKYFTSNPSPSTTVHATQQTTVNKTFPNSTPSSTITSFSTKHVKTNSSLSITTPVPQHKTVPSSTTGPTITPLLSKYFTPRLSTSVHSTRHTTVNTSEFISTTGPTNTPLLTKYFTSNPSPSTTVNRTVSSSTEGPTITSFSTKHVKPNSSLSITTPAPQHKTVNRTVTSYTTGPTITSFSTEHFTSNPSLSTTVHATQHITVKRTVPSSTTGPTITSFSSNPSPSTVQATQYTTVDRTVPISTPSSTITPLSKTNPTTKPNPIDEGTRADSFLSDPIITLLSRTQFTSTPSPFPNDRTSPNSASGRAINTPSTNTITKLGPYTTDQIIRPITGNGTVLRSRTWPITPLSTTHLTTKLSPYNLTLSGSKNRHITTLDTSGSTDNSKKKDWAECNIKACYGKEECEQEVEAYMKCMSVKPVVSRTSGVQVHVFMFMTHLLCSLLYIHI